MPRRAAKTGKKPPIKGKRYPLNMRTTFEVRHELEGAATASGRSLAQEAEFRIGRTFAAEKSLIEALNYNYDPELAFMMIAIGEAMKMAGRTAAFYAADKPEDAQRWWDNPFAFAQAVQAAHAILDARKPAGDPKPPRVTPPQTIGDPSPPGHDPDAAYANIGRAAANSILEEAETGHTRNSGGVERARRLRRAAELLAKPIKGFAAPEFRDADSHIGDDQ
jgi:hypothetical protein